jgi:hypothetical protein
METTAKIDPVRYGVMYEKVRDHSKSIEHIEKQVEELVAFKNKVEGGWIVALVVISTVSSVIGLAVSFLVR